MKTIYEFSKGDEIVRIEPAKEYSPKTIGLFGMESGGHRDRSYMGEKLIFVGIANGQIYCKRTDELSLKLFGDKMIDLSLDVWDSGWDLWVDPNSLLNGLESKIDNDKINELIKTAIENEDYELAEKLRNKLTMTKFINNSKNEPKTITTFSYLVFDCKISSTARKPSEFDNVEYIGTNSNGDIFKAWNNNDVGFDLYLGTKGDEFNY